ncbi:hypothetical protein SKB0120_05520 [Moraxella osloensis]
MSNQEIKSFLNAVDNAKLKTKPLPESYIADITDDYTKGLYATVLASLLVAKGVISPHCQNSCHPHLNNLNGGKGDNHGAIQCRTQTSNIKQTAIA